MAKPNPKKESAAPTARLLQKLTWALLGLIHVVCPLLFFTNLTRNPYYTQIALLNIGIALCGLLWALDAWRRGEIHIPRFSFEIPLLVFLAVAMASSLTAAVPSGMLRTGIIWESIRIWVFTLVNCVMALALPVLFTKPLGENPPALSIWSDLLLAGVWGLCWFGFHSIRNPDPRALIWDTYGAFLWMLAALYAVLRTRRGEAREFFHVIFAVATVASVYGILQYFGRDIIWTSPIQPYGGRPVSTFGNPNFLSSHLMLVSPLAAAFAFRSNGSQRVGYALVATVCAVAVLSTLTRSTYIGLFAAYFFTGVALYRKEDAVMVKRVAIVLGVFILVLIAFPRTPISAVQSPLARFTEIFEAMRTGQSYGPWHQRLLIWSSAWDMMKDSVLLGRGWGAFELFYPLYQGKYLLTPLLAEWRTHANNAHNVLLEIWAQTGILGTGAALWLLATMTMSGWIIVRQKATGTARVVTGALWGGLLGMVADNFFGNVSVFFAVPAFLFWWNVGALSNESTMRNVTVRDGKSWGGRVALSGFMVFCLVIGVYFFHRWKQELSYFEGFKESKVGDIARSYKALEEAYRWFPAEVNSNYELGNSYARHARNLEDKGLKEEAARFHKKSIEAYTWALRANPGYDEIYFNVGVTYNLLGETESAIQYLRIAIFINPLLRDAYGSLGNLYINTGRAAEAVDVFKLGLQSFPRDKDFWNNMGFSYTQLKQPERAFDAYKQAIMIDPGFTQGWQNLAASAVESNRRNDPILQVPARIQEMEAAVARRDYAAALAPARALTQTLPENADAHLSLANVLFYLGQAEKSEASYKRALEINPNFAVAHVNLGRLYQSQKRFEEARVHFNRALAVSPQDAEAKQALFELPK